MPATSKKLLITIVGLAALTGWWYWLGAKPVSTPTDVALAEVVLPELNENEAIGARAFAAKCAACHGENGGGVDGAGPPFIHKIYEPNHHGDAAFFLAAQNGVRAHHWPFGDMPPVEGVTKAEVTSIVAYIRTLQKANGVF